MTGDWRSKRTALSGEREPANAEQLLIPEIPGGRRLSRNAAAVADDDRVLRADDVLHHDLVGASSLPAFFYPSLWGER